MPTFRAESKIPVPTGNVQLDLQELRTAFYLLEEELRYIFNNLDSENFGQGFSDSLKQIIGDSTKELDLQVDADGLLLTLTESSSYRELENTIYATADGLTGAIEDIETLDGMVSEYYTEYTATAEGLTSRVGKNEEGLTALGKTVSENYTEMKQEVDDLSFSVVDANGEETTLRLSDGRLDLSLMGEGIRTAQSAAEGAATAASNAQSTADTASSTAKTAMDNASTAQETANNAAKTATNFLEYTSAGLTVGNKQSGAWSGFRTRMTSSTFEILDSSENILASYGANKISLGLNSQSSVIGFCGDLATISYDSSLGYMKMYSSKGFYLDGGVLINEDFSDGTYDFNCVIGTKQSSAVIRCSKYQGDELTANAYAMLGLGTMDLLGTSYIRLTAPSITLKGDVGVDGTIDTTGSITIDPNSTTYAPLISKRIIGSEKYQADFGVGNPGTGVAAAQILLRDSTEEILRIFALQTDHASIDDGYFLAPDGFHAFGKSGLWIRGRDNAAFKTTQNPTASENFVTLASLKSWTGSWDIGTLNDDLYFSFATDTNYNAGTNSTNKVFVTPGGYIGANGVIVTQDSGDRYFTSTYGSYTISFGIGSGGVNRGIWDTARSHWTLCNNANDTILRSPRYIDLYPYNATYGYVHTAYLSSYVAIYPSVNGQGYCGGANYRWTTVYAVNGTINTSDRNLKENISDINSKYEELFDLLRPVTYKLKGSEHERTHIGFIAQEVKESMDKVDLTAKDFAAYCEDVKTELDEETGEEVEVLDENGEPVKLYSLRYSEFIALNAHMIQKLMRRVSELEKLVS